MSPRVQKRVWELTGSSWAADASEDTDVAKGDDVSRRGQEHSSSFASSRGVMVWQINVSFANPPPHPPPTHTHKHTTALWLI